MEVELVRGQASEVRVLHKALALRTVVILDEVRQSSMPESKRDSLPLHVLLTHTRNNLYVVSVCEREGELVGKVNNYLYIKYIQAYTNTQ